MVGVGVSGPGLASRGKRSWGGGVAGGAAGAPATAAVLSAVLPGACAGRTTRGCVRVVRGLGCVHLPSCTDVGVLA